MIPTFQINLGTGDGGVGMHSTGTVLEHLITRDIKAPCEAVFRAWTVPEVVSEWWGPHDFIIPTCEIDARQGGQYRIVMRSPENLDRVLSGAFLEVEDSRQLMMTVIETGIHPSWLDPRSQHHPLTQETAPAAWIQTITFNAHPEGTRLTIQILFPSPESHGAFIRLRMDEGWQESLDSLTALLPRI